MKYRRQTEDPARPGLGAPTGGGLRKRRRGLGVVPTLFTLGNCLCGFASVYYASRGAEFIHPGLDLSCYSLAGYLIFAAMLFDMFDGFMARLTHSASDFGAELDSLADMVSFGVAPAYLALRLVSDPMAAAETLATTTTAAVVRHHVVWPGPLSEDAWLRLFWFIGAIYVCCTALRLARFNVINRHDIDSHLNFRGLPSPGAAAVVASTIVFSEALYVDKHIIWFNVSANMIVTFKQILPYLIPPVVLIAALLMVSRFAYAHLVNRFLRGRRRFSYVVRLVVILLLIAWQPQITALLAIYLYALSAPVVWLWRLALGRRAVATRMASAPEPPPPPPK